MTGKAVIRLSLVIALMITAHAIRPFSLDNLTTHLLGTARSLSFVLPESAVASIEHANYLAAALGVGAREDQSSATAAWPSPTLVHADIEIAPEEPNQSTSKRIKRPDTHKRAMRGTKAAAHGLMAARVSAPVVLPPAPVFDEMPVALPVVHAFVESLAFNIIHQVGALSASYLFAARQGDCEPNATKAVRLVAVAEERGKTKLIALPTAKAKNPDCKSETDAIEVEAAPVVTGPEEDFEQAIETYSTETLMTAPTAVEPQSIESITRPVDACPVKP